MEQRLTQDEEQLLEQALLPKEVVLWTGKPLTSVIFHASDWYLVPFSLMWGGFALFWEFTVTRDKAPGFFVLWGVPFVLLGQYFIWGRFIYDAWLKARTLYALTNMRVRILQSGIRYQQRDCTLHALPGAKLDVGSNGVGTIDFTSEAVNNPFLNSTRTWQAWSHVSKFAFVDLPEAREVRSKIVAQQERLLTLLHRPEENV